MHQIHFIPRHLLARLVLVIILSGAATCCLQAETTNPVPTLQIKADQIAAHVSPLLHGLMTEEINYSYEGGLYGELIRNRSFKANPTNAVFWSAINGSISLDTNQPLNSALNVSLKLDTSGASKTRQVGIANGGYWGIPVRPNTTYHVSFYAKAKHFSGALTVSLFHVASTNETTVKSQGYEFHLGGVMFPVASATVPDISGDWQKYEVTLTTGNIEPSKENRLVISATKPGTLFNHHGTIWFQQISLFPPTYKDRANGSRPDIMQLLADLKPAFLRFPGGNYLEGDYFPERFDWKKTVGDLAQRPGHRSPWNYWSTDGFGLPEFLGWCEDLNMEPVLAVFAGYALKHDYVPAGPGLEPYVQDALDEIEYVTGGTNTTWGRQRAKDGHPTPLPLHYVEIGNEDQFDRSGSYDGRFTQFYDAIKARYPDLKIIATTRVTNREPDVMDEHFYLSEPEMESHAHFYDQRSRTGPKVFVGEWATRVGEPTPNMAGALGDAAWMTGLERNSDLVIMSCYAPLFVNVSPGAMQWRTDLIGYDALTSYGSPAYYAQQMFNNHCGDIVLATEAQNIPTRTWQPPARRRNGVEQPRPPEQQLPTLFSSVTRDSQTGTIYLKVVNSSAEPQPLHVQISGLANIESEGRAIVLSGKSLDDTNSIDDPVKIVPVTEKVDGLGADFTRTFPPYSITVLELQAK